MTRIAVVLPLHGRGRIGVQCYYQAEFGEPAEGMLKAVTHCRTDLIVMGIHGAGALVRASTHFGTTTHPAVSASPAPVLVC